MAEAFAEWRYVPVDIDSGATAASSFAASFSPTSSSTRCRWMPRCIADGAFREQRVALRGRRASLADGRSASEPRRTITCAATSRRPRKAAGTKSISKRCAWIERIAAALRDGYVLTIDYGYTRAEAMRFPAGTLMGYRRHTAREDVLEDPGERDITAHVNFTALEERGAACGLRDGALRNAGADAAGRRRGRSVRRGARRGRRGEELRRRMQLKTLLFGMGETFRVLLQRKRRGREENRREKP